MNVEILYGEFADSALRSTEFVDSWENLFEACTWSTVFQSPRFCQIWYRIYRDRYNPMLVAGWDSDRLCGLLPMAVSRNDEKIVIAGTYLSEYQTWIATKESTNDFIQQSLVSLMTRFPGEQIRFRYLPPGTPLDWLKTHSTASRCSVQQSIPRPLMCLDPQKIEKTLKKKSNKSKLNRLQGEGLLEFATLRTASELADVFDEVTTLEILRHRAVHNIKGDRDPLKKSFYMSLVEAGLAHATVLKVGKGLVSAHIGNINKNEVTLGVFAFSPFYGKHSPGKIHMLLLADQLSKQGIHNFDLTPGGEYKERFSTHFDIVHTLDVFFHLSDRRRFILVKRAKTLGRLMLEKCGVDANKLTPRVKHYWARWKTLKPVRAFLTEPRIFEKMWRRHEYRVYAFDLNQVPELTCPNFLRKDCVADFLCQLPIEVEQADFLTGSLEYLGSGCHSYTRVRDGRLVHCSWLIPEKYYSSVRDIARETSIPQDSCVLKISCNEEKRDGCNLQYLALCQILCDAATLGGYKFALIAVARNDFVLRKVVEQMGFAYRYSLFETRYIFMTQRWSTHPVSPELAAGLTHP